MVAGTLESRDRSGRISEPVKVEGIVYIAFGRLLYAMKSLDRRRVRGKESRDPRLARISGTGCAEGPP